MYANRLEMLQQGYWVNGHNKVMLPEDMETNHIINLLFFLKYKRSAEYKRLADIEYAEQVAKVSRLGGVYDIKLSQQFLEMPAKEWVQSTVLWQELTAECKKRCLALGINYDMMMNKWEEEYCNAFMASEAIEVYSR